MPTNVPDNTVYCTRHGWAEIVDKAELVPGVFVPVCHVCAGER